MLSRRLRVLGLLTLLGATTACTEAEGQGGTRADMAVPSYAPPSAAPEFCARLAATTHLTDLPSALGDLAIEPGDVEAKLTLDAAIDELRGARDDVPDDSGHQGIDAAFGRLVGALSDAREGPLTDSVLTAVITGLDEVGTRVQPLCGFPS